MSEYFASLIDQSLSRTREATLSMLSITDRGLRQHLASQISNDLGTENCFFASPVFEHTFGWETCVDTLGSLEGGLLNGSIIKALGGADNHDYRFPHDLKPYKHQLVSWQHLLQDEPKSAVITTGTGSGKTECFMVPILQDLVREYEAKKSDLVGVRALFLYPLNALINSQQQRLNAWTASFGSGVRFCLYNGNTVEKESSVRRLQQESPNQILTRERLRKEPAPILMTNATMLEYMLIRQVDNPILRISREQQSLRWIVLDEAHTYVGSQAAELSLLLRRVVEAFGKQSSEIRFIATSATIADKDSEHRLAEYLSSLAGVDKAQVLVVSGRRNIPALPTEMSPRQSQGGVQELIDHFEEDADKRFEVLSKERVPRVLRSLIVDSELPVSLSDLINEVGDFLKSKERVDQQREVLQWLDLMSTTSPEDGGEEFVRLRVHLFQRVLHGLWCCVNPSCGHKGDALENWAFGKVHLFQKSRCNCGSPVFELAFCQDCRSAHLVAEDSEGILRQCSPYVADEFSLQRDDDIEETDAEPSIPQSQRVIIAAHSGENAVQVSLDLDTAGLGGVTGSNKIQIHLMSDGLACCSTCGNAGRNGASFLRHAYLGAPFYVTNAVPTVLEYCPDHPKAPNERPGRGRRLITFTDSRQGTARMAVRMQQEAERSKLRGLVFQTLRGRQSKQDQEEGEVTGSYEDLIAQAAQLEKIGLKSAAKDVRRTAEAKQAGAHAKRAEVSWSELVNSLASTREIGEFVLDYNKHANPQLFSGHDAGAKMARLLLAREFSRRPKNQNSMETLGLVSVGYRGLDRVNSTPKYWTEARSADAPNGNSDYLSLEDWKAFLKVALDFYVRENTFVRLEDVMRRWMGSRFSPKELFSPKSDMDETTRSKRWPQIKKGSPAGRLVKLLEQGAGIDRTDPTAEDKINYWLEEAWRTLVGLHILETTGGGYALNLETLTFSLPERAWVCVNTHRFLDTTFCRLTPYLPNRLIAGEYRCREVALPHLTDFAPEGATERPMMEIRERVAKNVSVAELRSDNLWTDISDRTVEGGFYYRTAEHSAQQSSRKLIKYEEMFKQGTLNVMNCSTTMEMGVDIGGVSAVLMNNVPPHPANYRQRAGRAGRRNESRSITYTLCKADPHNTRAFLNPKWPFETRVPSPAVALTSASLVQRHVNSFLLSKFLEQETITEDRTKLTVRWFFGGEEPVCERFSGWLYSVDQLDIPLCLLVKNTALEAVSSEALADQCRQSMVNLGERWRVEHRRLMNRLEMASDTPYKRALELELKRHEGEYLLRDLAARAFLPGYGFPTDVVNLNTYNIEDFLVKQRDGQTWSREDNTSMFKEQPSRTLSVAIREYAPGAQVVIDGRVFRSSGIGLHWHSAGLANEAQKFDISWRCGKCAASGISEYAYSSGENLKCSQCGEEISEDEKRHVLQPTGFVTDFYEPTTNDVTGQKYIPMETPRISVVGNAISLPDSRCGFVRFGNEGAVFYQSAGEHRYGYAVCLRCGRAESMTNNDDLPAQFRPGSEHRPVGGVVGSRKGDECSAESVKRNVYLGYQSRTDVLELVLRNPRSGQWLPATVKGKVIATTIAVALRDAVAELLGIASSEMGFGTRYDRDLETGATRSIVQIYDNVAGGAGFVSAGLGDIVRLIRSTFERLHCPANCENVCSSCLAGQDSRVELEQLDRTLALEWFMEGNFSDYLVLPEPLSTVDGAVYLAYEPSRFIRELVDRDAVAITLKLGGEIEDWDFSSALFRNQLIGWKIMDDLSVNLAVPKGTKIPVEIKRELAVLAKFGITISELNETAEVSGLSSPVQIHLKNSETVTLVTNAICAGLPGTHWLNSDDTEIWCHTRQASPWACTKLQAEGWDKRSDSAVIEVTNEINGDLLGVGKRFKTLIEERVPDISQELETKKIVQIKYVDRYLRSPLTVALLGGILSSLRLDDLRVLKLVTVRGNASRRGDRVWHDWFDSDEMKDVVERWFSEQFGDAQVLLDCKDRVRDVQHRRVFEVGFETGDFITFTFDQGMGYWSATGRNREEVGFNFDMSSNDQCKQLDSGLRRLRVTNSASWPTQISVFASSTGEVEVTMPQKDTVQ